MEFILKRVKNSKGTGSFFYSYGEDGKTCEIILIARHMSLIDKTIKDKTIEMRVSEEE